MGHSESLECENPAFLAGQPGGYSPRSSASLWQRAVVSWSLKLDFSVSQRCITLARRSTIASSRSVPVTIWKARMARSAHSPRWTFSGSWRRRVLLVAECVMVFPCWRPPQRGLVGMRPRPGISGGCKGLFASRGMPAGQGKEPFGGAAPGRSFPRSRPLAATGGSNCRTGKPIPLYRRPAPSIMGIMFPRESCEIARACAKGRPYPPCKLE